MSANLNEAYKNLEEGKPHSHPLTPSPPHPLTSSALIIGASLTGLMTASVLAKQFDQVILIERSDLPDSPQPRKGVPQSHQYHGLMAKGYQIMQALYPELEAALIADGIPMPDSLRDFIVYAPNGAGYLPRLTSNICVPTCSRHRLEWHIRKLTLALPNVTAVSHTEVLGLQLNEDKTAVSAVHVHYRAQAEKNGTEIIPADLVVDCSGRHSKIETWLTQLGLVVPLSSVRETAVQYTTRLYHIPQNLTPDWSGLLVTMQYPENPRFGGLRHIEDNLWQVALAGMNGHQPPTDDAGFLAYAKRLASPIIYQAIEHATPATPAHAYHNKLVRRRHFEKVRHFPQNLLVLGDANCSYNPLYGQGMTSAALMVAALEKEIGDWEIGDWRLAAKVHKRVAKVTGQLWQQATQLDELWANPNPAEWTLKQRLMNKLSRESLPLLAEDPALFIKGTEIRHLLRPVWQGINGRFLFRLLIRTIGLGKPAKIDNKHPKIVDKKIFRIHR